MLWKCILFLFKVFGMCKISIEVSLIPPTLVLSSAGIAAEYPGGKLGQYELRGVHNSSPYYVQTDTLTNSPIYLFRADINQWYVTDVLGKSRGGLKNPSTSVTVPHHG